MGTSIHPIRMNFTMVYAIKGESEIVIDGGAFSNVGKFIEDLSARHIGCEWHFF